MIWIFELDRDAPEATLVCTKGLGRLSVLYFGVLWSFLNKELIVDKVKDDFLRPNPKTSFDLGGKLDLESFFN